MVMSKLLQLLLLGLVLMIPFPVSAVAQPATNIWGSGDSAAAYDFCLDYIYPKRDVAPIPGHGSAGTVTKKVKPRTDFYTDSGAAYDFYLDWMSPRIKPKSPRIISFLTFKQSGGNNQAAQETG